MGGPDKEVVSARDVQLVIAQTRASKVNAITALWEAKGDIVDAIMVLESQPNVTSNLYVVESDNVIASTFIYWFKYEYGLRTRRKRGFLGGAKSESEECGGDSRDLSGLVEPVMKLVWYESLLINIT